MAATGAFQGPHQLDIDATLVYQDLKASLRPYLSALIKPDSNTDTTFTKQDNLVLTEKELVQYDTPEHGELDFILLEYHRSCESTADASVLRGHEQVCMCLTTTKSMMLQVSDFLPRLPPPSLSKTGHGVLVQDAALRCLAYLDHHPAGYELLAEYGGLDITDNFHRFHNNQPLTAIDLGDAKHAIHEVGRLVPAQTAIGDDQFVLDDCVFALKDLNVPEAARQRCAGQVVAPEQWQDTAEGRVLEQLYNLRGD